MSHERWDVARKYFLHKYNKLTSKDKIEHLSLLTTIFNQLETIQKGEL